MLNSEVMVASKIRLHNAYCDLLSIAVLRNICTNLLLEGLTQVHRGCHEVYKGFCHILGGYNDLEKQKFVQKYRETVIENR